jgi:hypothetical protein
MAIISFDVESPDGEPYRGRIGKVKFVGLCTGVSWTAMWAAVGSSGMTLTIA